MKMLIVALLSMVFSTEAMSRADFDEMYSGNSMSPRTATYVYLCSKVNHASAAEGCVVRMIRDRSGPDGCCDACSTMKNGLFVAAVSVDESEGDFLEHNPRKLIWSGAFNFYQKEKTSCSYFSGMGFCYAYNVNKLVEKGTVFDYCSKRQDRFAKLQVVDEWFHPCDDILNLSKFPHMKKADGEVESILYGLDYEGIGGIHNIVQTSLMRWRLPQAMAISEFLEYAGSTGELKDGVRLAPEHAGSSLFSSGYNCVAFSDVLLQKMGLTKPHKPRFERDTLLKGLLKEGGDAKVIIHSRSQHETLGKTQICDFILSDCTKVEDKDFALFWR